MNQKTHYPILSLLLVLSSAAPVFVSAEIGVDASFNDVSVDDTGGTKNIRTGNESRTQLSGDRGMIRVGANSQVSVRDSDEVLDLQQGVMMVKTGRKGLLGRQSLSVETEQIRATTNATMLISYQPRRYIKIACLEGKVTVSLKGLARETVTIRKGQLLIINCLENVLPDAVSVDMNRLMQTSPLLAPALNGRPARSQPGGSPRTVNPPPGGRGDPPPPANGGGNGQQPPPPQSQARAQQAAQATPQARGLRPAQPRANDLAIRQIDCRNMPNAAECRQPGLASAGQPGGSQSMPQSQRSQSRSSQRSRSRSPRGQPPPPLPPPPPPPPPPGPPGN